MSAERFQRVMQIVGEALEHGPDSREAWVIGACAGDETLRAEVTRLLEGQTAVVEFLEESPVIAGSEAADRHAFIGSRLGPYRIISEIARGGMGTVYLGQRDDKEFARQVAIKLIKRGMDTDFVLQRFRNERQILAGLDHPNIARLIDGGTVNNLPYFVMEYVDGVPITKFADAHELGTNDRLKLFRTVCAAAQYAHQNLVIHRDLKPPNILVTKDGAPKLLDFGIAKLLHAEGHEETALTQAGLRVMTPEYASPEQVKGERVTTSSDVYSLGVLLYELLTGQRPYRVKSRAPEDIAKAICEQEPTKPSQAIADFGMRTADLKTNRDQSRTNPQSEFRNQKLLRGDLDNIILKALRKEPERRYTSVEQFSEDIRLHLEGLPVTAHPDSIKYRVAKFVQRNKIGVAAAAIILVTLTAGIITTSWQARRARAESARAQQRFNQVRKLAHSLMFDYHDDIAALPGSTQARQRLVKDSLEYLDSLANDAGNDLSLQREIGTAYQRIGEVQGGNVTSTRGGSITYANLGDIEGALASLHKALIVREKLAALQPANSEVQQEWGTNITRIAELSTTLGKPTEAAVYLHKAMDIYDKLLAADPKNESLRAKDGSLPYGLARILGVPSEANFGKTNEAMVNLRKALSNFEALAAEHPGDPRYQHFVGVLHANLGTIFLNEGKFAEALDEYRTSVAADQALVKANPTNAFYQREFATVQAGVGRALLGQGKTSEALENCREAVKGLESLVAADSSNASVLADLANKYRNLSEVLAAIKDHAGAQAYIDKSIQTLQELSAKSPSNATARFNLGLSYLKAGTFLSTAGDQKQAIEDANEATKIGEALIAIDENNASGRTMLAQAYYQLGIAHALWATHAKTSGNEQMDHWREARGWYQKSLDTWTYLQKSDTLGGGDRGKPDELAREIAKCDAALGNSIRQQQ